MEPVFHADSYGYRPGRSAIDAVRQTRQRCWRYDFVLDIDVKGYFDSIDSPSMAQLAIHRDLTAYILRHIVRLRRTPAPG